METLPKGHRCRVMALDNVNGSIYVAQDWKLDSHQLMVDLAAQLNRDATRISDVKPRNTIEGRQKPILLQITLFLAMVITIILGIWVRLTGAGRLIIFWGIPLLILALLHFVYQIKAIRRIPKMEPSYIFLILLSNLILFLGFALQVDFGDAPGSYLAIVLFYARYFNPGSGNHIPDGQSDLYMFISIGFLIALIVSWFVLLGDSFVKQENNV